MSELPQYRSHKIVRAAKVKGIGEQIAGTDNILVETDNGDVYVPMSAFLRGRPEFGDYIIVYPDSDDYISWSPAAVFEAGYTAIEPGHVFAGAPDARQSGDVAMPTSRFRPTYRALLPNEIALHNVIKEKAAQLEALIEQTPKGRYQSLALTELEASIQWAIKGLTA